MTPGLPQFPESARSSLTQRSRMRPDTPTAPPIVTGSTIRKAATASLQASMQVVLPALATISGVALPQPVQWWSQRMWRRVPEEQSPAVYLTSPGIDGRPTRVAGSAAFRVDFGLRAYVVVEDNDYELVDERLSLYLAALRTGLLADPSLGGLADACDWADELEDEPLDTSDERTIAAGSTTVIYRRVLTASTVNPLALATPEGTPTAESIALALATSVATDDPPDVPSTVPLPGSSS